MEAKSEITTAARRITRTLNAHRPGFRFAFDKDGQETGRVYGPEAFGPEDYFGFASGGWGGAAHKYTYREVQDLMDQQDELREMGITP